MEQPSDSSQTDMSVEVDPDNCQFAGPNTCSWDVVVRTASDAVSDLGYHPTNDHLPVVRHDTGHSEATDFENIKMEHKRKQQDINSVQSETEPKVAIGFARNDKNGIDKYDNSMPLKMPVEYTPTKGSRYQREERSTKPKVFVCSTTSTSAKLYEETETKRKYATDSRSLSKNSETECKFVESRFTNSLEMDVDGESDELSLNYPCTTPKSPFLSSDLSIEMDLDLRSDDDIPKSSLCTASVSSPMATGFYEDLFTKKTKRRSKPAWDTSNSLPALSDG